MTQLPALSLAAVPGRRLAILDIAREAEKRGFPGIYGPSLSDNLALCEAIALVTERIEIGTGIRCERRRDLDASRPRRRVR